MRKGVLLFVNFNCFAAIFCLSIVCVQAGNEDGGYHELLILDYEKRGSIEQQNGWHCYDEDGLLLKKPTEISQFLEKKGGTFIVSFYT